MGDGRNVRQEKILCIRLSGLGDVVHALNALSLLRQERPEAHIAWVVEDRFSDLLRGHPCIDELITTPRKAWGAMSKNPLRWPRLAREMGRLARRLRAAKFGVSIDFQSGFKGTWIVHAAGAPVRIGFGKGVGRELNYLVQNRLVRAPLRGVHRVERDLALLAPLGIPTRYAEPALPPDGPHSEALDDVAAGQLTGGPLVVIHPGTSKFAAFKRWMPDRYARVADQLVADRGADVLVSCGPEDKKVAEQVVEHMERRGSLAPATAGLKGLVALLRRADLFIGSDTGPMHIASALNVPVVALFGPKDPVQTGPYCSRSIVVTAAADCRPCSRRKCPHVRCMTGIAAEQVLEAALALLDGAGEKRAKDGHVKKPLTCSVRHGPWRGEIATCYSSPRFFQWLDEHDPLLEAHDGVRLRTGSHRSTVSLPSLPGAPPGRLVAKVYRPRAYVGECLAELLGRSRARNSWNAARRMGLDGIRVPFHVCHLVRGDGCCKEQVLVAEEVPGVVSVFDWLTEDGMANWLGASQTGQDAILRKIAEVIRRIHQAGHFHGDLRDKNLLVQPEDGPAQAEVYAIDIDHSHWVGWMPRVMQDILRGLDLRRFVVNLKVPVTDEQWTLFFEAYYKGWIEGRFRRALIRYVISRFPKHRKRRLARERSASAGEERREEMPT